jgi:hypothetical protein
MGDQPPAPVERTSRVRQWFAGASLAKLRRLFLLLVLGATAAFGGLDTVDSVTPFKPGEKFSDGQFTVTIERARLLDEVRGNGVVLGKPQPGKRYLGVVATLRNDGTVPGRLRDELTLPELPEKELFGVFRLQDGSPIQTLGAGFTEQLAFAWLIPETAVQPGQSVTVVVWKKAFKQLMVTYGGKEWLESQSDYGRTVVPVKESA